MSISPALALLIMALTLYLVRLLPFLLLREEIKSRFIRSFLYYVPFVTLTVMTFPAILTATRSVFSGLAALLVAVILAFKGKGLFTVSVSACAAVYLTELVLRLL